MNTPIPEDMNELRAELHATAQRFWALKREYRRRQLARLNAELESFDKVLKNAIQGPLPNAYHGLCSCGAMIFGNARCPCGGTVTR